jgi:serine/threonine-protein kinase
MLGRYALVREIARSNDVVYEGLDTTMNRRVAVKELSLDPTLAGQARRDRIERFFREARAAGAMNHPNIVTIHEVGEDRGRFFIAMEFLEGQTLRERMAVAGALPLSEAVKVTAALCDALEYAHQRGVVHRDIKPDNIHLLPGGQVKLTDFGIARILTEQQLTVAGQIFGTPSYMSPEQVMGGPVDARSDIFSLGVLLYEMLTGRKPFLGDTVVTITYKIMHEPTPAAIGVPPEVEAAMRRAMAKTPDERFRSAAEFRAALEHAAAPFRTGGYPAGSFAQAHAVPPVATAPAAAPPLSPLGATVAYGAATQQQVLGAAVPVPPAPMQTVPPAAAPVPSLYPPADTGPRRPYGLYAFVALLLVTVFGFTAYGFQVAQKNASQQAATNRYAEAYNKAAALYKDKRYEEAATAFDRIRSAPDAALDAKRNAMAGQVYSYRMLGQQAQSVSDFPKAEDWYRRALALNPNDPDAKKELDQILKARGVTAPAGGSGAVAGSGGSAASGNDPNNPLSGVLSRPGPGSSPAAGAAPPGDLGQLPAGTAPQLPSATAADFQRQNAAGAAQAAQLLAQGNQAAQNGDYKTALDFWRRAVAAGPGSPAALEAQAYVTRYSDKDPLGNP